MSRVKRTFLAGAVLAMLGLLSACNFAGSVGSWEPPTAPGPAKASHAALLPDGKVLLIEGSANNPDQFAAGTFKTFVWNPGDNTYASVPTPYDAFCSGHAFLANGKLLVAGGLSSYTPTVAGSPHTYQFNWQTERYEPLQDMASGHWYPTVVSNGDGKVLAVAGVDENHVNQSKYQVFDPATSTWSAEKESQPFFPYYPALTLTADGRFFYSGVNTFGGTTSPGFWEVKTNTFTSVPGLPLPDHRDQGASVLLPPAQDQKVMVIGGGSQDLPTDTTAIIDLKRPSPSFVRGPSISAPKQYLSAVLLPDRTVFRRTVPVGIGRSTTRRGTRTCTAPRSTIRIRTPGRTPRMPRSGGPTTAKRSCSPMDGSQPLAATRPKEEIRTPGSSRSRSTSRNTGAIATCHLGRPEPDGGCSWRQHQLLE